MPCDDRSIVASALTYPFCPITSEGEKEKENSITEEARAR